MPRTKAQPQTLPLMEAPAAADRPRLMLMDGHALVHRSWHAISITQQLSTRKTGENTTAVYGFATTFLKALQDWKPTHCAIAFDRDGATFRHLRFEAYKAQRPPSPPELRPQFARVRQLMEAFNVPIYELQGYEADDVLGCLCRQAEEKGIETLILTGDTDTLQLVSPYVKVVLHYRIQDRKVFDEAEVTARYGGLRPAQLPDFKALKGDPSDNIPGVPGVGDKTAIRLLVAYGSVEGLYQHIQEVTPESLRENLMAHQAQVLEGKLLATIVKDLPVTLDLEATRFGSYDRQKVIDLFRELEFFSLVNKVPEPTTPPERPRTPAMASVGVVTDYRPVTTLEEVDRLAQELRASGAFALDMETSSMDPMQADLVGLALSTGPGHGRYVALGHNDGPRVPLEEALARLKPVLEDPGIPKVAHNANYDMTVLANHGVTVAAMAFDTMIAAHLLGRKALGLKALALDVLGQEMTPITDLIGTGRKQITMAQVPLEQACTYACADVDMTMRLRQAFQEELRKQGLWDLFTNLEMPLVPVLVDMQLAGVALDVEVLRAMSRELHQQLQQLEVEIYDLVGHQFNIGSTQQLADVLFNELGLAKTKRTKTGYSTDAAALEALRGAHPVVDKVLEHRQLSKLKSTYADALPELVNPRTGRLHTSFNQTGAITGRISSSEPNLQNIPVRTELGRQVRKAFVAPQGRLLLSADYSQIELRVLAHLSQDPALLSAFHQGQDIHAATASMMFNVPIDKVNGEMRRIAKILNFGVIYGLSPYGISQQTGFSPEEGQKFITTYFSKYPGIKEYIESTVRKARQDGYVETMLGRRRYTPEINASNFNVRQATERVAINMPIQGTAADIMKLAMLRVHRRLAQDRLRSLMVLQVHDELMFEVPVEEVEALKGMVLEEMPQALQLSVPLKVEVKTGQTWGDME